MPSSATQTDSEKTTVSHRPSSIRVYWKLCCAGVVGLSTLALSPFVIPQHVTDPVFFGVPRTLWAGILVTILLVALTMVGAYFHPVNVDDVHDRSHRDPGRGTDD